MSVFKKILIADTSAATKALLSQMLNDNGYGVDVMNCEKKACEALKHCDYTMVIASEKFIQLCELSKSHQPNATYYMTTAFKPKTSDANYYIEKPLQMNEIEKLLLDELQHKDTYSNAA